MVRKAGPNPRRAELIKDEIKAAREPIYIRELARCLQHVMSYGTVWKYVNEFMPEVNRDYRYGPSGILWCFWRLIDRRIEFKLNLQ